MQKNFIPKWENEEMAGTSTIEGRNLLKKAIVGGNEIALVKTYLNYADFLTSYLEHFKVSGTAAIHVLQLVFNGLHDKMRDYNPELRISTFLMIEIKACCLRMGISRKRTSKIRPIEIYPLLKLLPAEQVSICKEVVYGKVHMLDYVVKKGIGVPYALNLIRLSEDNLKLAISQPVTEVEESIFEWQFRLFKAGDYSAKSYFVTVLRAEMEIYAADLFKNSENARWIVQKSMMGLFAKRELIGSVEQMKLLMKELINNYATGTKNEQFGLFQ